MPRGSRAPPQLEEIKFLPLQPTLGPRRIHRYQGGRVRTIGRFIVKELLGTGTQGAVYRCSDPVLQREVAIKLLQGALHSGKEPNAELLHEARAIGGLNHQNLVSVFDIGEFEGRPYLVFELVEGQTLAELLRRGPLSQDRAMELLGGILAGIEQAHARGVVHRDLKPANIIVTEHGIPKVTDFGIAAVLGKEQGAEERLVGTPRYMAPEYIARGEVSKQTDVFALGLMAYELLAGRPAYQGRDARRLLEAILAGPPVPLADVLPEIDSSLQQWVERALQRDPALRFSDAAEMGAALKVVREKGGGEKYSSAHATVAFLLRRMRLKSDFPALARNFSTLNRVVSEKGGDSQKVAEVIARDHGLSSKVLRVVNSAYYAAFSGRISSISRAVVILGINGVRAIAASLSLLEHFGGKGVPESLYRRLSCSLYSGLCAREIGQALDGEWAEQAMLGTMLRGLGGLLVTYYLPEEAEAVERLVAEGEPPQQAEHQILGVDYARIGKEVAREWNFPREILQCLEDREALPRRSVDDPEERLALVAGLADRATAILQRGRSREALVELKTLVTRYGRVLAIDPLQISGAIGRAKAEYVEFKVSFADRRQRQGFIDSLGDDGTEITDPVADRGGRPVADTLIIQTSRGAPSPSAPPRDPREILDDGLVRLERLVAAGKESRVLAQTVMETLQQALGFHRLVVARWDPDAGLLRGHAALGEGAKALSESFKVRCVGSLNLFSVALIRDSDVYIADAARPSVRERIPEWLGEPGSFLILPVRGEAGPLGLIYGEYRLPYGLDEESQLLQRAKRLRDRFRDGLQGVVQVAMVR